MTESHHHIIIVGDQGHAGYKTREALRKAGFSDCVVLDQQLVSSVFDDATDTWVLSTAADETLRADVVVTNRQPFAPWIPDIPGQGNFRGEAFHAAAWEPEFDPTGKRVAVVGTDAAVAHHMGALLESARSVTAFAVAPRRFVTELPPPRTRAARWLRRRIPRHNAHPAVQRAESAIHKVTSSGVRTSDGVDHEADAIIYGTGYAVADHTMVGARGLTIRQTWDDGMEPFLGLAIHGFPNYFLLTGPDTDTQLRYVIQCLRQMMLTSSSRIEVRRSAHQVFNERAQLAPTRPLPPASAFDVSSSTPPRDDVYDGAATLQMADIHRKVRVRLTGHLDPLDGNYHWQGTILDALPPESLKQARLATLSVGERSAAARITEETPWGTHSVKGEGAPPYPQAGR